MEKNEKMEITIEQISNIKKYLESRLGMYGIDSFGFREERLTDSVILTQKIDLRYTGILKHMLRSCELEVRITPIIEDDGVTKYGSVNLSFNYVHIGGGSNGHRLGINLHYNNRMVYEGEFNE